MIALSGLGTAHLLGEHSAADRQHDARETGGVSNRYGTLTGQLAIQDEAPT
jgi:hypothetical protein